MTGSGEKGGTTWQRWNIIAGEKRGKFAFNGCSLLKNRRSLAG